MLHEFNTYHSTTLKEKTQAIVCAKRAMKERYEEEEGLRRKAEESAWTVKILAAQRNTKANRMTMQVSEVRGELEVERDRATKLQLEVVIL